MISVGGVEKDGSLFTDTNLDLGQGGSLTVNAATRDVKVANFTTDDGFTTGTGTSLAAPAVVSRSINFAAL